MGFKFGGSLLGTLGGAAGGLLVGGPVGALVGAGLGGMSGFGTDMTNEANKQAVKQANQLNVDYWNMQNTYNNPVSQMARLKAAGLNPNLVYSSGNVTGNNASGIHSATASNVSPYQMDSMNMIQAYQNIQQTDASTQLTKANTKNALSQYLNNLVLTNENANRLAIQTSIDKHNLEWAEHHDLPVGHQLTASDDFLTAGPYRRAFNSFMSYFRG